MITVYSGEKEVKMRKTSCRVLAFLILLGMFFVPGTVKDVAAEVNVDINIGVPPPFVLPAPPLVVVIPGTYVYLVPDIDVHILFYQGYWYRPYKEHWYRARSYDGPWGYLAPARVPRVLVDIPPHYYRVPKGYHRIPYGDMRGNWEKWEHSHYWDKDKQWQDGWQGESKGRGHDKRGKGHKK